MKAANNIDVPSPRRSADMGYDPFARGQHPVGVCTIALDVDAGPVLIELWYPATEATRGRDLDAATRDTFTIFPGGPTAAQQAVRDAPSARGVFPLVLYCHGGYGHRRECSHLCTHLASHGYVVAAANFPGDSITDLMPNADGSAATIAKTPVDDSAAKRPSQASFFIERLIAMDLPAGLRIDASRIGTAGISMGGYTSLAVNSVSRRPMASFAMCPMYGDKSLLPAVRRLQKLLRVDDWERPVPTCVLTGAVDPLVNVEDMRSLYHRLATPKRLVVVERAGHLHWADGAKDGHEQYRQWYLSGAFPDPEIDAIALGTAMRPFSELCTEEQGGATARALCLAHMDAYLKNDVEARLFLDGDLASSFAARGIDLNVKAESRDVAGGVRL